VRFGSTCSVLAWLLTSVSAWSCVPARQASSFVVALNVQSDPGRPLANARVLAQGKMAGVSDANGLVSLSVQGQEGSSAEFLVECPEGYRSPVTPIVAVLRRANQVDRRPEYAVSCPPLFRTLVVAVRTEHGANLPVLQLGREVARTDRSGAAHVVLKSAPEETLELTLDTSSNAALRPRNPTTRFRVGQGDELLVFNQSFKLDAPKPQRTLTRRVTGPVRIQ